MSTAEQPPQPSSDQVTGPQLTNEQILDIGSRYIEARQAFRRDIAAGRSPLGKTHIDLGPDDEARFAADADRFIQENEPFLAQAYNNLQTVPEYVPNRTGSTFSPHDRATRPSRPPRPRSQTAPVTAPTAVAQPETQPDDPATAPTEVLPPVKRFDHSQAFLPWMIKNRVPGLKKLWKARKLSAVLGAAAVAGDYLTANIVDKDFYGRVENGMKPEDKKETENAATPTETLKSQIEIYNERFQDKTYVPSVEEYEEMAAFADRIRIANVKVHPDGHEDHRIRYQLTGTEVADIRSSEARPFLDAIRSDRWKLSEDELQELQVALATDSQPILKELQYNRRQETSHDYLNYTDFIVKLSKSEKAHATPDLIAEYHDYLNRRRQLDRLLRDNEEAIAGSEADAN